MASFPEEMVHLVDESFFFLSEERSWWYSEKNVSTSYNRLQADLYSITGERCRFKNYSNRTHKNRFHILKWNKRDTVESSRLKRNSKGKQTGVTLCSV